MLDKDHLASEDILRLTDGELSPKQAADTRDHLAACWTCRARLAEIEKAIVDFVRMRADDFAGQLPAADGPRALLKARLAQLSAEPLPNSWSRALRPAFTARSVVCAAAVLLVALFVTWSLRRPGVRPGLNLTAVYAAPLPDKNLTPGSVRPITSSDVCNVQENEESPAIPASVQKMIFENYRMPDASARDFELDYLITPELGGAADIRNLWPEPHSSVWNSYVKDDLEIRLHQLVCEGKLDLHTAQREIATDWISAYKKYFETDRPIQTHLSQPQYKHRSRKT